MSIEMANIYKLSKLYIFFAHLTTHYKFLDDEKGTKKSDYVFWDKEIMMNIVYTFLVSKSCIWYANNSLWRQQVNWKTGNKSPNQGRWTPEHFHWSLGFPDFKPSYSLLPKRMPRPRSAHSLAQKMSVDPQCLLNKTPAPR